MLSITEIEKRLKQRYPFLYVDRVLELEEENYVVAIKNVSVNEPWVQGHFPENPILPGVIMIETAAQVGGLLLVNTKDDKEALISTVNNFKFIKPVTPGDQLVIKATLQEKVLPYTRVKVLLTVEQKKVAEGVISYCFCL